MSSTIPIAFYRPMQKLHPLSLLAQFISREANGCLKISSGGNSWFLHLEKGKLVFASDINDPFGRLDRHLRRMSLQAPSLVSAVRVQVRIMFEMPAAEPLDQNNDYRAICWLVEQQHLTPEQAATLIDSLSRAVIESFLPIQTGSYELIEQDLLADYSKFCQLDLRAMVEDCHQQLHQRQPVLPVATPVPTPVSTPTSHLNFAANSTSNNTSNSTSNGTLPSPKAQFSSSSPDSVGHSSSPSSTLLHRLTQSLPNSAAKSPILPTTPKTYTIACIDDSPTVLQAINAFLDDKSFSVVLINDPVKALMQIIRSKPDLILLDVTMPNLDGYELCSLLRKHPNFRSTPVIMVTGNTGFIDRAKAKLVGASGYLTKPFTQSDLIKIIFKHLS
jgi:two-component system, chemotaxis family, response regulator PixG